MNISPVSMYRNSMSFRCAKCEEKANQQVAETKNEDVKEDKIVGYSSWGGDYIYPIYESQVKACEENIRKAEEAKANRPTMEQLQGETLEEYHERHKVEWSI